MLNITTKINIDVLLKLEIIFSSIPYDNCSGISIGTVDFYQQQMNAAPIQNHK